MYIISRAARLSETTFCWEVVAEDIAKSAQPGHFVMLRLHEGGERIPLTIADFDREKRTVTLVVQAVGKTTRAMLDNYGTGDRFTDLAGPLGIPSEVENFGHVVVVGGGLGVAPIFPQLRAFKQAGCRTTAIIGFRNAELVFWEERFRPFCDELIVCTDDGSYGRKGFVTQALGQVLDGAQPVQRIVAVGPLPMMKACAEVSRPSAVPTVVSLNAIMVDGTGMCGSCRVTVGEQVRFACVDGPEFDAHRVDFDELMRRQRRFFKQEQRAEGDYEHVCNLEQELMVKGRKNYKKLRDLAPKATPMPERPAEERATNFEEVNLGYSIDSAINEAERCIQCIKPTCISGCPVGIDIPGFIRHLLVRDIDGALEVIQRSNAFPSICGRVCPQESQCEAQCIVGRKLESVAIGRLERFVGDHARSRPIEVVDQRDERVAIVGSGPAGLACAADLARAGVAVTIYEALHVVGGVLAYGIPRFRLPRETISKEIDRLKQMGVAIETNKIVGKTFTLEELLGERGFSAVFVATGAGYPSFLGIPGEHAGRVYSANEFLTRVNLMGGDRFPYDDTPVDIGDSVAVIGAGNTAMDCLRVAQRLGAKQVHCVYRRTESQAPARVEEVRHAKEEGIHFHWLRSPLEVLLDDDQEVVGLRCQQMELGPEDDSGRSRPQPIAGAEQIIACDTVISALGTQANPIIAQSSPTLKTHHGDYIEADATTQATSMPGVFAGGDIVSGGATVILAMGAGRRAAAGILSYLADKRWPPSEVAETALRSSAPNSCPRCGKPIGEEESYVCCADARLTWRCNSCHKVSEGFAFPFGLCPACGGTLEATSASAVVDPATHQAIRRAFEIELGGSAFYQRGAAACDDAELRALFERLAQMEAEHTQTLSRRYHVEPPDTVGEPTTAQIAVYAGTETPRDDDALALLRLAVRLEERARDFFVGQLQGLAADHPAYALYRELAAEEQEHVDLLGTELRRRRRGQPGVIA
ncbi:MAG: NADPH-dependent glutamate synthase [Deltaproteobacteria bacterium]|nr:NADPH-dependent glutamate synthase [Deltaproteobacteria bacterium]